MKEIKQYKCEQCGTLYADKDRALQCEKGHKSATKIVSVHYLPHIYNSTGCTSYPNKILVEFNDGTTKEYRG